MRRGLVWLACLMIAGCADEPPAPISYCYASLADVICYDEPDQGREGRLVGEVSAPPD